MEFVVGIDHSAKRIGLSNVSAEQLLDIISYVKERQDSAVEHYPPPHLPDVLQAYADPLQPALELREICQAHGIEFVSYSTLGTQHTMRTSGKNPVLGCIPVTGLAERYGRSTAEVVLSWALQRGMSVIPRSNNELHIKQLSRLLIGGTFLEDYDLDLIDGMAELN